MTAPQSISPDIADVLQEISQLASALRQGGPDPMDLQELSDALWQATNLADNAIASLQPATPTAGLVVGWQWRDRNSPFKDTPWSDLDDEEQFKILEQHPEKYETRRVYLCATSDTGGDAVAGEASFAKALQPATPTACPYKGPFGCKCEPGECKYTHGGDAAATPSEPEWLGPCCPFCGGDPFHRTDAGEAVAVVCCDLGDLFFRGARKAPEEVTLSWEDFYEIGGRLAATRHAAQPSVNLHWLVDWVHLYATEGNSWISKISADKLITLAARQPTQADANRLTTEPLASMVSSTHPRPLCSKCGLEDGACICAHLAHSSPESKP
jgi:hypothetical protein